MNDVRERANGAWSDYKAAYDKLRFNEDRSGDLLQSRSSCYLDFPDPLEFQDDGYTNVHLHIYEGFIQFMIIAGFSFIFYIMQTSIPSIAAVELPIWVTKILLFLNFIWRIGMLLYTDFEHIYRFRDLSWETTRSLITLGAMLAPSWCWYRLFKPIYDNFGSDKIPSWFLDNASWIQFMAMSMHFGEFDLEYFKESWSFDSTRALNSTNSTATWSKWNLAKESVAATISRFLIKDPFVLNLIATALALALYRIVKSVIALMKQPMLWILKPWLVLEKRAVRYRDSFAAFLVKILCIAWRLLECLGVMQRASVLAPRFSAMLKTLALVIFSNLRLGGITLSRCFIKFRDMVLLPFSWISNFSVAIPDPSDIPKIRLLEVEPSLFRAAKVNCRLSWYSLDEPPSYTAVSYVWGSSELTATIFLNGRIYKTTASAEQALMGLRSKWRTQRFWIDAICIDQSSAEDKAEQISQMAEIYKRARAVTVWLGYDKDARLAIALARRLLVGTRHLWFSSNDVLKHANRVPERAWLALQILLRNQWFERSWVVQEVLHDNVTIQYGDFTILWWEFSRFAMAISGEDSVFAKLDSIEGQPQSDSKNSLTTKRSRQCIRYIRVFEDFKSITQHQASQRHLSLLFYLVRMFRSECKFRVTETKDRVYSLVNLCGLASHQRFRSDFVLTRNELFTLVAQHLLSSGFEERRLDLLFHAGIGGVDHAGVNSSLPSWVPDWSLEEYPCLPLVGQDGTAELLRHPMMKGILQSIADLEMFDVTNRKMGHSNTPTREKVLSRLESNMGHVKLKALYRATGHSLPRFKLLNDPMNTLELEGKHLDYIKTLGSKFPRVSLDAGSSLSTWKSDLRPVAAAIVEWSTLKGALPNFIRVLIGDLSSLDGDLAMLASNPPTRPASATKFAEVAVYVHMLVSLHHPRPGWSLESFLEKDMYPQNTHPSKELRVKNIVATHEHIQRVCAGRKFGVTESGFTGLFPQGTRARANSQTISQTNAGPSVAGSSGRCEDANDKPDQVCLFFGADTPFVVRKCPRQTQADRQQEQSHGQETKSSAIVMYDRHVSDRHDYYQLVGPAYLHGFMDGEGTKETSPTTVYRLR